MNANLKHMLFVGAALIGLVFVAGCGMDQAPLASSDESTTLAPAAKQIKSNGNDADVDNSVDAVYSNNGRTVRATFGPQGGRFRVFDPKGKGKKDDIEVILTIPEGVLKGNQEIAMTVDGDDIQTLVVSFEPSGATFLPSIDLRIDLGNELAPNSDVNKVTPYHLYGDNTIEPVDFYYVDRSSYALNAYIKVPGFSRYGLSGDYWAAGGIGGF